MNTTGNVHRDGLVKDKKDGIVTEDTPLCLPDQKHGLVTEEKQLCLPVKSDKDGLVTDETQICLPVKVGLLTDETRLCLPVTDQNDGFVTKETTLCLPVTDQNISKKLAERFHDTDSKAGIVTEKKIGIFHDTDKRGATLSFLESKVQSLQTNVNCEKARKIQKAVVGSLRYFLSEVQKIEPLFCVSNLIQVGSYSEGTKLHKPDEFDFLVELDGLSKPRTVVLHNTQQPGCVAVALADDTLKLKWNTCCVDGTLQCFQNLSLRQSYFGPTKFGIIFVRAIRNIMKANRACLHAKGYLTMCTPLEINFPGDGFELREVDGITLHLTGVEFKTPNVLIGYRLDDLQISVDLTPTIRYHKIEDCFKSDECASPQLVEAVISHGSVLLVGDKRFDFRISVTECEVLYMQEIMKREHKFIYMFLKYIKGNRQFPPFSSYMLKNVCIHHDARCQPHVKNVWACFENIVEDMNTYCTERRLPSAINSNVNLFSSITKELEMTWDLRLGIVEVLRVIYKLSSDIDTDDQFETVVQQAIDLASARSHLSSMFNSYEDHTQIVLLYRRKVM